MMRRERTKTKAFLVAKMGWVGRLNDRGELLILILVEVISS
jgi:hypothetical protein